MWILGFSLDCINFGGSRFVVFFKQLPINNRLQNPDLSFRVGFIMSEHRKIFVGFVLTDQRACF
jgi:hypothetical protein